MPRTRIPAHRRDFARRLRREMTDPERLLWGQLRAHRQAGLAFRRQTPIGPCVVDFACHGARLIVELDGGGHSSAMRAQRDTVRDAWLAKHGYRVLRFWNEEVVRNLAGVVETILAAAASTFDPCICGGPPSLPSPSRGEGSRTRSDRVVSNAGVSR